MINRIAAGEVIQRPSSAVKEVLENSIDAGSTQITITVKEGGLKVLQITDNGHGIREPDLPILCQRHTTSKLSTYEDLESMQTLGFRGEALCSVSFVSHMSVTTMTANATAGLKASYRDGEMLLPGPKMCAANPGTTITVEDLFFNSPTRRKSFKNGGEEYTRILDIVGRYAVLNYHVAIAVKRQGEARVDLQAPAQASQVDRIGNIYGADLARDLLYVSISQDSSGELTGNSSVTFNMKGYISGVNYSRKKTVLVLFINKRCVESSQLRRAVEAVYASVLPRSTKPFAYIEMTLPPQHVDVNIHPTKREVHFSNQEEIICAIVDMIQEKLTTSNDSRTFVQARFSGSSLVTSHPKLEQDSKDTGPSTQREKAGGDHKLVRTDPFALTLDAFVQHPGRSSALKVANSIGAMPRRKSRTKPKVNSGIKPAESPERKKLPREKPTSAPEMIKYLIDEIEHNAHTGLCQLLNGHSYIGMADETLAFIQYQTGLFLVDTTIISQDMFYEQLLRQFTSLKHIKISPAPAIKDLARVYIDFLETKGEWDESKGTKEQICSVIVAILERNRQKLASWYSLLIEDGHILALPNILDGYNPDINRLPELVVRLGRDVDWSKDVDAVHDIAKLISENYAIQEPLSKSKESGIGEKVLCKNEWVIRHVIFAALRSSAKPHAMRATDGTIAQVTTLEKLYKVFERC